MAPYCKQEECEVCDKAGRKNTKELPSDWITDRAKELSETLGAGIRKKGGNEFDVAWGCSLSAIQEYLDSQQSND